MVRKPRRCPVIMPRAKVQCGKLAGHSGSHATPESLAKPKPAVDRKARLAKSQREHAASIQRNYGISAELYWNCYSLQGGRCAICMIATGRTKRLAVDHNHKCQMGHDPKRGCESCVRGLLCSRCNRFLGQIRDDPAAGERMARYLRQPPFQEILKNPGPDSSR